MTFVTLPDGAITVDSTRWLILSGALFAAVLAVGGLCFFRYLPRRELLCSATVLAVLNLVIGLAPFSQDVRLIWSSFQEWDSFRSQLLLRVNLPMLHGWLGNLIIWILPPFLFVLFGEKTPRKSLLRTHPSGLEPCGYRHRHTREGLKSLPGMPMFFTVLFFIKCARYIFAAVFLRSRDRGGTCLGRSM